MSVLINAYSAASPGAPLTEFTFDPGELRPDEVEIAVRHCGICHSDISMVDDEWGWSTYPFVPGHEIIGTIVSLGTEAKGLVVGQSVGVGWTARSCQFCHQCLGGRHHICPTVQGTMIGRHGGFADRIRVQWLWARPLPEGLDPAIAGPLFCGGVTVFAPLLLHGIPSTARVGVIGIGGLGHMALQFARKWGCEVHAFTTSDDKEQEASSFGAHYVHNTKRDPGLKSLAGSLDILISTVNVPQDTSGLLSTLAPKGVLHVVGGVQEPMPVPAFGLIMAEKSISGSPTGSPTALDDMLMFSSRHGIAPMVERFPMSRVNDAMERLRSGKARYRVVLDNDVA
jgi:uncharacterized zinc-type alcohol dehydrogenase-like protein